MLTRNGAGMGRDRQDCEVPLCEGEVARALRILLGIATRQFKELASMSGISRKRQQASIQGMPKRGISGNDE